MNIVEKEFIETKIACKMSWEVFSINTDDDIIEVIVSLKNDINDNVKNYFKRYPLNDFLNKEALCKKICEDCDITPC